MLCISILPLLPIGLVSILNIRYLLTKLSSLNKTLYCKRSTSTKHSSLRDILNGNDFTWFTPLLIIKHRANKPEIHHYPFTPSTILISTICTQHISHLHSSIFTAFPILMALLFCSLSPSFSGETPWGHHCPSPPAHLHLIGS